MKHEFRGYEQNFEKLYLDMIENFYILYINEIRSYFNYKNIFDTSIKNDIKQTTRLGINPISKKGSFRPISVHNMITLFITFDYIDNKNISDQIFFDSINKLKESNFLLVNKYYQKGILELQRMKTDLMKKESHCV